MVHVRKCGVRFLDAQCLSMIECDVPATEDLSVVVVRQGARWVKAESSVEQPEA